jgi:hypothetical protein
LHESEKARLKKKLARPSEMWALCLGYLHATSVDSLKIELGQLNSVADILDSMKELAESNTQSNHKKLLTSLENSGNKRVKDNNPVEGTYRKTFTDGTLLFDNLVRSIRSFDDKVFPSNDNSLITFSKNIQLKIESFINLADYTGTEVLGLYFQRFNPQIFDPLESLLRSKNLELIKQSLPFLKSAFGLITC